MRLAAEEAEQRPPRRPDPVPAHRPTLGRPALAATEAVRGSCDQAKAAIDRRSGKVLAKRQAEDLVIAAARDIDAFYRPLVRLCRFQWSESGEVMPRSYINSRRNSSSLSIFGHPDLARSLLFGHLERILRCLSGLSSAWAEMRISEGAEKMIGRRSCANGSDARVQRGCSNIDKGGRYVLLESVGKAELAEFPEDWDRALAVAAHPDDLEYEAGGSIARWTTSGRSVAYLLASRGEAGIDGVIPDAAARIREDEQRASAAVAGVTDVTFLDHPDGTIEYGRRLRRDIAAVIRRYRPQILIAQNPHYFWPGRQHLNQADHRAVGLAALDAARDAANRWIFPELLDEGLEPWTGVRQIAIACSPYATHAVDVTDSLDLAITALREHKVYLDELTDDDLSSDMSDPQAWMRAQAKLTGKRFGGRPAEMFELIQL